MLRLRLTFKGVLTAGLALLAFLLGAALDHPYLNLSAYALLGVLIVGALMGYLAIRGIRIMAVASRRAPDSGETDVWVSLDSRKRAGPFGLDVDGNREQEILVQAPDRVGRAFHLSAPPERFCVELRSLPLGLVEITRRVPVTSLEASGESNARTPEPNSPFRAAEPDGRLREHRPGEGMRQVHWPMSARLQRLIVRVRNPEVDAPPPPESLRHAPQRNGRPTLNLDLVRAFTVAATMGAVAFLWQQGALATQAIAVLFPLVLLGGVVSLRRAGPPSRILLLALYVGILGILGFFVSDLRTHVIERAPVALTVMSVAALFAWDLRDRSYIRAQLFLVVFASVLLPAFFPPRDALGVGIAFAAVLLSLLLAAWAEGRHAIGASRVRFSELGSLTSAIVPFAFFAAMVLILHPWLPAVPLPSLPTFGLSQVRTAQNDFTPQVPGQQGRVHLDARWPQGNRPAVEVQGFAERLRAEVFDTYRAGEWRTSSAPVSPWPVDEGSGRAARITLRADGMRILPLPVGTVGLREALLEPMRLADGSVRLSRPAWNGYTFEAKFAASPLTETEPPTSLERFEKESSPELAALARSLAGGAETPLEALDRIAAHLRKEFRYDLQAPEAPEGVDPVLYFLTESRRGFCVHFASALSLMGRELGIPTRFVAGYSGGRQVGGVTIFDERHAHAWVEAYVEGRWLTLDPTPGGTFVPPFSMDQGRVLLAAGLLVGLGLVLWRRRREPELVRRYRWMLQRLSRRGVAITEATTPREALELARAHLDESDWEQLRDLVGRYEIERFR